MIFLWCSNVHSVYFIFPFKFALFNRSTVHIHNTLEWAAHRTTIRVGMFSRNAFAPNLCHVTTWRRRTQIRSQLTMFVVLCEMVESRNRISILSIDFEVQYKHESNESSCFLINNRIVEISNIQRMLMALENINDRWWINFAQSDRNNHENATTRLSYLSKWEVYRSLIDWIWNSGNVDSVTDKQTIHTQSGL